MHFMLAQFFFCLMIFIFTLIFLERIFMSTTSVANFPPVSTTPLVNFATGTVGVVDLLGANLTPVSAIREENLPLVSTCGRLI